VGHVACIEGGRGELSCLLGFGWEARRSRWEDNMKMNLREIGIDGVKWIQIYRNRQYFT